ncbi:MAG: pirin family protein [Actinomycetota bacterium]|nr:pirin family protein [Actinomycetota bacterium]MDQ2957863.1 pirin family protein [Actinomycetota bacterium]
MRSFERCPGEQRARTTTDWLDSRHSFSYRPHYDPDNTHFGLLLAHNEDLLQPGPGFTMHRHRDFEILTWVIEGCLEHQDSAGHRELIRPGTVQLLSAGSGVEHAEFSGAPDRPVHLVQMWLSPDRTGEPPSYSRADLTGELAGGELVPVAAGSGQPVLRLRQRDAVLWAARLPVGDTVALPSAPYLHLFLARGSVEVAGAGLLRAGDALRIIDAAGDRLTALEPAELLVWSMAASVA